MAVQTLLVDTSAVN